MNSLNEKPFAENQDKERNTYSCQNSQDYLMIEQNVGYLIK